MYAKGLCKGEERNGLRGSVHMREGIECNRLAKGIKSQRTVGRNNEKMFKTRFGLDK